MEAAIAFEVPAAEVRERLAEFVGEVAERLPHVRQRENALVYVRGLIEYGGRKSLQPTLFRLGESAAWAESRNSDGGLQAACACWSVSCEYRCWGVW